MHLLSALLFIIVSYNVENLFHPSCDSVNTDSTFMPEGARRWTYTRYYNKEENLARVLTNIGRWDGVDVVGLQEVENAMVVRRLCATLKRGEYDYVHYDSPDRRGIDVALVYKKSRMDTLRTQAVPVVLQSAEGEMATTRDILYVCGVADKRDTLHFFVCHLPSQLGGAAASEWKRAAAKRVLQQAVDSLMAENPAAKIIVMGDMNSAPKDDIRGLRNKMTGDGAPPAGHGSHKHQGRWTCLDQFYVSHSVDSLSGVGIYDAEWLMETDEKYMGLTPKRCYKGLRYQSGYSDHLPVILYVKCE